MRISITILGTWIACVLPLAIACGDGDSGDVVMPADTYSFRTPS